MAADDATLAVRCVGVSLRHGLVPALNNLSLDVGRGECFGLMGPNGAGKTALIETLEGLRTPHAGQVELLGLSWESHAAELRQRVSIHLKNSQLDETLTVADTLTLFRTFYRRGPTPEALSARVGLAAMADRRVSALPSAHKQQLALACALAGDPELLFLDEPTSALDPQARQELWKQLRSFRAGGGTTVLATHYLDEAVALCDRVAVLDRGQVMAIAHPAALLAAHRPM